MSHIKKDTRVHHGFRRGFLDPAGETVFPALQRQAPFFILRHNATGAVWHATLIQPVIYEAGEIFEVCGIIHADIIRQQQRIILV